MTLPISDVFPCVVAPLFVSIPLCLSYLAHTLRGIVTRRDPAESFLVEFRPQQETANENGSSFGLSLALQQT